MWEMALGEFSGHDAWRGDFPLHPNLPGCLKLDLSRLKPGVHPMFAIRLQIFADWHKSQGRDVEFAAPEDRNARCQLEALNVNTESDSDSMTQDDRVLPITRFREFHHVEEIAGRIRHLLEYDRPQLAHLGGATFMIISELCNNAIEHGGSLTPAYVAAAADADRPSNLMIAIADLGIGIPEHVRHAYPEWSDDSHAIALATYEGVSGTGDPHRGYGYFHVFDKVLSTSLHAAEFEIHSANGFLRTRLFDGRRTHEPAFPPPRYRRGTAIVCKLVSADV